VGRIFAFVGLIACAATGAAWYFTQRSLPAAHVQDKAAASDDEWLDELYSSNPAESAAAAKRVEQLGAGALPIIHTTLQDPSATTEHVKAALKACGILGPVAAPAIVEVAEQLPDPDLTAEAAIALSFMGPGALAPLREALRSENAVVRREALRSIGKLRERAPLKPGAVLPLLVARMQDTDPGVRTVAATYLGILHEGPAEAVPALAEGLKDPDPDVRRASAAALGSFGDDAQPALPALKKAATDADEDVAREAGVALVKLQPK
jgi:HEAT repeat protein